MKLAVADIKFLTKNQFAEYLIKENIMLLLQKNKQKQVESPLKRWFYRLS